MIRLVAALLVFAALPQGDDLRKRVRELVEQLQSDEIQALEDAQVALIALGPAATDAIKDEIKKVGGDTKLRLEEALRKIDRNVKRGRALGAPILVTVNAKGKPIADLFEEMKTSTGQPIACHDLPPDKITIAFEKLGFWEALDRVCKTHGGVMWAVKEKEIVVSKRAYRDLPKVFRGNQIVYFERLSSDHQLRGPASPPTLSLEGGFAWTRSSIVPRETLVIEEFQDDQGTDLRARAAGGSFTVNEEEAVNPEHLVKPISFSESTALHERAQKLVTLKGALRLEYVLESRKVVSFEKPAGMVGKPVKSGNLTVTLQRWNVTDGELDARVHVQAATVRDRIPIRASGFRVIDSKGVAHPAAGSVDEDSDEDTGKVEYEADLELSIGGGIEIASLEFTIPIDIEEIVIPFDFKDLPLK